MSYESEKELALIQNRETNILMQINEKKENLKFIIKLLDYCVEPHFKKYYIIQEYCEGGSLKDYAFLDYKNWQFSQPLTYDQTMQVLLQLVSTFQILYRYKIMHRDLKPGNILLKNGDIKLADFGFARDII